MKKFFILYCFLINTLVAWSQQPNKNLLLTRALIDQKRYDEALEYLKDLKKDGTVYLLQGECYYRKKDYSNAVKCYLEAESITDGVACYGLSCSYANIHENASAIKWLKKYLSSISKKSEIEIISDSAFLDLSKTTEWKALWMNNWYSEQESSRNAITALIKRGNATDALGELELLKDRFFPKHEYFALISKAYVKLNMTGPAVESINKAIALYVRSDEYFELRADLFLKNGQYSNALDDISRAIRLNPNVADYYLKRVEIARLAGDFEVATADLNLYRELYPNSSETYHQLGLLENARGNYLNALDYYDQLIAQEQGSAKYFVERGGNALMVNQIQKADEDFGMALDLNPTLQEAYLKKGKTRFILLDNKGACFYWQKAMQFGSSEAASLVYKNCKE